MTDFVQTMKDWRRMCKYYSDKSMENRLNTCLDICPLRHNTTCGVMENALDSDIKALAKEVAKWAAEHPEPVYPSWLEYLMDVQPDCVEAYNGGNDTLWKWMWTTPIPADIAEKLGVKLKEGT